MLSPGNWHTKVPRGLRQNLLFRRNVLRKGKEPANQRLFRQACKEDCLFWVNAFVVQFNPRKKGEKAMKVGPFITWPFQEEAVNSQDPARPGMLWCIEHDEDLLIEKSREMGASWLMVLVHLWLYLYHDWQKFLFISRSEKAVEDEDPDSLFWKIDFVLDYLPDWSIPGGRAALKRRKLFFGNANGSSITGEASTGKAGVGGRATSMPIDEFSQIKEDYEVLHRTSDTTGCRIFNGTHRGLDTAFYELSRRVDMKKLVMHWSQHPDKNRGLYRAVEGKVVVLDKSYAFPPDYHFVMDGSPTGGPYPGLRSPWYDKECRRKGDKRAVAMDLDIDPSGSVSQFFDPIAVRVLQETYCTEPRWHGDLLYDPDAGRPLQLTAAPGGPLELWCPLDAQGKPPAGRYAIGSDISTGNGATPSCLSVVNRDTGEKAGQYQNAWIAAESFAALSVALCWLFADEEGNGAAFCWEHHGPGINYGNKVIELGYRNVYYRKAELGALKQKNSDLPGWIPLPPNKRVTLEEYRAALYARQFLNRSRRALEECLAFKWGDSNNIVHAHEVNEDPTKARVNHADLAMADALAWKMCKEQRRLTPKPREEPPLLSLAWRRRYHERREEREGEEPVVWDRES